MGRPQADVTFPAYCDQKRRFSTAEEAEAWAARHYACAVCIGGTVRMEAFPCADHFHVGHMGHRP